MARAIFSISFQDDADYGAEETFLAVRATGRQPQAFFFASADAIGEPAATAVIGLGPFEKFVGHAFGAMEKVGFREAASPEVPYADGGLFGCIGYEAVAELEPKLATRGQFAHASPGDQQLVFARDLIVFDFKARLVYFIGEVAQEYRDCLRLRFVEVVRPTSTPEIDVACLTPSLGRAEFIEGVARLKEHIRSGDIFQAVLAERFEYRASVAALDVFCALRRISPTPYSFFFTFDERDFFGASPEALLKIEGERLLTHPIAGTRPRGETAYDDQRMERQLVRSRKEAAEHLMLVDLARNDLGRVARAGSVRVNGYRTVQRFSNVMHLVSEVMAELAPGISAARALGACFPAGTLSGAPKFRAMEILAEIEKVPRGFYGGAVVAYDPLARKLDACIAIRSLEMRGEVAVLRAGAGIVADSKPQAEYEEILQKLKPLRQALAVASQGLLARAGEAS